MIKNLLFLVMLFTGSLIYAQSCSINAGTPRTICGTSTILTAVPSGPASKTTLPTWTIISKPAGAPDPTFSNANAHNPTVSGMTVPGPYVFRITQPCTTNPAAFSYITITSPGATTGFTAGADITTIPATTGIAALSATVPSGYAPSWTFYHIYSFEFNGTVATSNATISGANTATPTLTLTNKANHNVDPAYRAVLRITSNVNPSCWYEDDAIVRFIPNHNMLFLATPYNQCISQGPITATSFFIDPLATSPKFSTCTGNSAGNQTFGTTVLLAAVSQPAGGNIQYSRLENERLYMTGIATGSGNRSEDVAVNFKASYCITGDCNSNTFLNTANPNTIEYDNMVSNFHSTRMRDATTGALMVWGDKTASNGSSDLLIPTEVNSANFTGLTGKVLKFTGGSNFSDISQTVILTTTGLFAWGTESAMISGALTSSDVFQKLSVGTFGVNGGAIKTDGLPDGVAPEDVKMFFGSYQTLALTTCSGEAWVLALNGSTYGDNAFDNSTNDMLWHRVHTSAATTLDNIVAVRGSGAGNMMALSGTGEIYNWGNTTWLGDGSISVSRAFATKMTPPTGVTPKMIGVSGSTYYVLGTNGNVYAIGSGIFRQLGDFTNSNSNTWVQVRKSAVAGDFLTDVVWISPNEHDPSYPAINVLTADGRLWAWGSNQNRMLGGGLSDPIDPMQMPGSIPIGSPYDMGKLNWTDKVIALETGGHTSMIVKENNKRYGYVGHRIDGSMADGTSVNQTENEYNFANTPQIDLCGAPAEEICTGLDSDGDGVPDMCDLDVDNDGILNTAECGGGNIIKRGDLVTLPSTPGFFSPAQFATATGGNWTFASTGTGFNAEILWDNITAPFVFGNGIRFQRDGQTQSITQSLVGLHPTTASQILVSKIAANNGAPAGNSSTLTVSYAGVEYARIVTTDGVGAGATISYSNGATSSLAAFAVSTVYNNWTINLPLGVAASGDLKFEFVGGPASSDDFALGNIIVNGCQETDGDGIPDYMDLDSDNDGCLDAIEGTGGFSSSDLVTAGGTVTVGVGSPSLVNQNLCGGTTCVDANGIPTIAGAGQGAGSSQNALINNCNEPCYKPGITIGTALDTKVGITSISRAGATDTDNWPMIRKGGWLALESQTKGFVPNRVEFNALGNPIGIPPANFVEGMMVFDTISKCMKMYTSMDGGATYAWYCLSTQTCTDIIVGSN